MTGVWCMTHDFENYDDRFSCPNCDEALPFDEFPQTCEECGFLVEVFLTREDSLSAAADLQQDSDVITSNAYHVYGLGWVMGLTDRKSCNLRARLYETQTAPDRLSSDSFTAKLPPEMEKGAHGAPFPGKRRLELALCP